jgi:hypothetical protein
MLAGLMRRLLSGPWVANDYVNRWDGYDEALDDYVRPLLCVDAEVALTAGECALVDRLLLAPRGRRG